jgi:hypothetical protein
MPDDPSVADVSGAPPAPCDDYRVSDAAFRAHLQTSEANGWNHFDDVVFRLAAGGIALSLTFLSLMKTPGRRATILVFIAWGSWAVALMAILWSIITAQAGLRSQIARWDSGDYYAAGVQDVDHHATGVVGRLTPWLNHVAAIACALGLVFFVVFAFLNSPR